MEERNKREFHIKLPQIYTCSMTENEAAARQAASLLIEGVQFKVVNSGHLLEGYVAGRTKVTNEANFEAFNELVESLQR